MHPADCWKVNARAFIGRFTGRVAYAVVTDDGLIHAAALAPFADEADASLEVIHLLRNHPDLRSVGVDFATNARRLRDVIAEDHRIAGAHVTALGVHETTVLEPLLEEARRHAEEAAQAAGPVRVRAASDGSRDKKTSRGGYGWVTETGLSGYGPLKTTSALEAELVAIQRLLAGTDPDIPLVVEVDSRATIRLAACALSGAPAPATGPDKDEERCEFCGRPDKCRKVTTNATATVLSKISTSRDRDITLEWVKGHAGATLNECADKLAQLGRTGLDLYQSPERVEQVARTNVEEILLARAS